MRFEEILRQAIFRQTLNESMVGGLEHFVFFHILGKIIPTS